MKFLFSSLLIFTFISSGELHAQDYFIDFKGTGESPIVSWVKIENMNQGTSLTIKGNEVLHLIDYSSLKEAPGSVKSYQIEFAPNPMAGSSRMQFYLPESGSTTIDLFDFSGKKVAQTRDILPGGVNSYLIQGLDRGIFIVAIKCNEYTIRGKLISTLSSNSTPKILFESSNPVKGVESISMQYNEGDRLKLTGYSGKNRTLIVFVPSESTTISFRFITCTDGDENNYPIVGIGTQYWMAENLRTIRYKNGDLIPVESDNNIWRTVAGPACSWYNNEVVNLLKYGALYNWFTVTDDRKVCPAGWHVPTYDEWTTLISLLGGESPAGNKLKENGIINWSSKNPDISNESGFSALPGGYRTPDRSDTTFFGLGESAKWWSSSQENIVTAWYWTANNFNSLSAGSLESKQAGLSLRCVLGDDQGLPALWTKSISDITSTTAASGGFMNSNHVSSGISRGVCWNTSGNPTIEDNKTCDVTGRRIYTSIITSLYANTTYYVRAYATRSTGTAYGNEVSFTTSPVVLADLTTAIVSSITPASAISGGTIINDGGGSITSRGVCWATSANPTLSDNKTTDGSGTGSYTSNVGGLQPGTTYHIRSYSTNAAGTAYGDDLTFTTEAVAPSVITTAISDITTRTANSGGNILSSGGSPILVRGLCWSTVHNPTVDDNRTADGADIGSFTSILTGLDANTTYYVRAYAVNSVGTAYDNETAFTTPPVVLAQLTTASISDITSTAAITGGNITNDGGGSIISRGVCWAITGNPTISGNKTTDGTGNGSFISNIAGLQPGTTYHVRSYSNNAAGTAYGNEVTFTTAAIIPAIVTAAVSGITQRTAISGGNITSEGGSPVTLRGICWSTSHNPTVADRKTTDGTGGGSFTSNLTGLDANTTYFVRSYAINAVGTAYDNEISFTTKQVVLSNLTTTIVSSITSATAVSGGNISDDGGGSITGRGVCWATTPNPTTGDNKTIDGTGTGTFISNISGLQPAITYHIRSYSINTAGTAYGNDLTFTTAAVPPVVSTGSVSGITQRTAVSGGNITSNGGSPVTGRGVCWSLAHNPTTTDNRTSDGSGNGSFTSNITGLVANTTYYLRAYAVSSAGTGYGNEISFITSQVVLANLTTSTVSSITSSTAVSGGNITDDGGGSIISRGVCWATSSDPAISDLRTIDGTGTGSYTSNLSGLQPATTYHVRAYATNSAGTAYGIDRAFTTTVVIPTLSTVSVTGITEISAISGGIISSNGGSSVTARGICWSTLHNPTTAGSKTSDGSGNGSFTSNLTGLDTGTVYYVRAYAVNSIGTAYGNEIAFRTFDPTLPDLNNGLAGYWKLDETSGNAADQLGAHNGTPFAIRGFVTGKIGSSYDLSKSNRSYINCGALPLTINTLSVWVKRTSSSNNVCIAGTGGNKTGLWINSDGNLALFNNAGVASATWGRLTETGIFHHIVLVSPVTGASGKAELYVDGISQGEQSCANPESQIFVIGSNFAGGAFNSPNSFDGAIDEVSLWNRALNATEITELYSNGAGYAYPFAGPLPNEVYFYMQADRASLLHSAGNKRVIQETVGSVQYLRYSGDNGVTYNTGSIIPSGVFLNKARILENGNIVLFGSDKIYYSTNNLTTIQPCVVLDKTGTFLHCISLKSFLSRGILQLYGRLCRE